MGRLFLRMSRWVRHPPSPQRVRFVLAVLGVALLIVGLEKLGWWPDWATAQGIRR